MAQYSILKQIKNGKLILWDGPGLARRVADSVVKCRRRANPKDNFFVYREESDEKQT